MEMDLSRGRPDTIVTRFCCKERKSRTWRRQFRGLPENPVDLDSFDVVVVGGGVPGSVAALTAARLGERVALVRVVGARCHALVPEHGLDVGPALLVATGVVNTDFESCWAQATHLPPKRL